MKKESLSLEIRETVGKGSSRKIRAQKLIPGAVYGKSIEPIKVTLVEKDLRNIVNHKARVLDLTLSDKSKHTAILKEIQYDPINNMMVHADFQVVQDDEEFKIAIPIKIQNERTAHGVKMGGQFIQQSYRLKVLATLKTLPNEIDIDVKNLGNSESIIVRDLPEKDYKIISHPTVAICSISKAKEK